MPNFFATDLMLASRAMAEAKAAGAPLGVVRGVDALRSRLAQGFDPLLIVDLDAEGAMEAIALGAAARPRPRVLAIVSHVRADLAAAARAAGADEVMARSAFVGRLGRLMSETAG